MKKILIITALILGCLVPLLARTKEFYYILALLISAFIFLGFKRNNFSVVDLLIIFIITIPMHTFRFGSENAFIRLSEIAFIPLFIYWILTLFLRKETNLTIRKEFILLFIFLIINIISTQNSMYPAISWQKIFILAYLFIFSYIVTNILDTSKRVETVIKAMVLISSIASIIAALQSIIPQLLVFERVPIGKVFGITFYRAGVGWHDPNYFALFAGMNAALTFACIFSFQNNKLYKICFPLQLLGVIATFSRTVSGSLLLTCIYLLIHFRKSKLLFVVFTASAIMIAIVTTSMLTIYKNEPFLAALFYRVPERRILEDPTSIMGHRAAAFIANWKMFIDHPVIGVGPFMAIYKFAQYRPSNYESPPRSWLASHNAYLQLLAEKGIFGFLTFMIFILLILKKIRLALKKAPDNSPNKNYLLGLKSSIFVLLIASLTLETLYELQFWLTIGLILAILNLINKDSYAQ